MQKLIQTVTFTVTTDRIRGQARPRFSRWGTYKDDKQVTLIVGEKLPRERRESELLEVTVEYFVTVTERETTCQTYTS